MRPVLLVCMPFALADRPSIALGLLKSCLAEQGVSCDAAYFNVAFAALVGLHEYRWFCDWVPAVVHAGDWAFSPSLYDGHRGDEGRYVQEMLAGTARLDDEGIRRVRRVRELAPGFLARCAASVPWEEYAVVGFTMTLEQTVASLALAREVKRRSPRTAIVFGGANCEGEMGRELHRSFPFIDYVCSGDGEERFPWLVRRLLSGEGVRGGDASGPGGITYRENGRSLSTGPPQPVKDLDAVPIPDYADFYDTLEREGLSGETVDVLPFETSRGCWWGERAPCAFCGLNGSNVAFRRKSPKRAVDQLRGLCAAWKPALVQVIDNILDPAYFKDLLPELAASKVESPLFWEVRANLSRRQIRMLREAGVTGIQPGIESFSTDDLERMAKGTTALQNVRTIKWCREEGIVPMWNVIYGFPGETSADYEATRRIMSAIRFLDPPWAHGTVRLDRFSRYHASPEAYGFTRVRPVAAYDHVYRLPADRLGRLAYHFDFDYVPGFEPGRAAEGIAALCREWRSAPEKGTLFHYARPDGALAITDTRSDALRRHEILTGPEQEVYTFCDADRPTSSILRRVHERFPGARDDGQIRTFLERLVAERWMASDRDRWLSLSVRAPLTRAGLSVLLG